MVKDASASVFVGIHQQNHLIVRNECYQVHHFMVSQRGEVSLAAQGIKAGISSGVFPDIISGQIASAFFRFGKYQMERNPFTELVKVLSFHEIITKRFSILSEFIHFFHSVTVSDDGYIKLLSNIL